MSNLIMPKSDEIKKYATSTFVRAESISDYLNKLSLEKGNITIEGLFGNGYQYIIIVSWIESLNS